MPLPSADQVEFLVCDNARAETGGKLTLIGFFAGGDIQATDFPAAFPLAFVFILKGGEGEFRTEFSLLDPNDNQLFAKELQAQRKLSV